MANLKPIPDDMPKEAFYGELKLDGKELRVVREPSRCPLTLARIDKSHPRMRIDGTPYFVRYLRNLTVVDVEALNERMAGILPSAKLASKPAKITGVTDNGE